VLQRGPHPQHLSGAGITRNLFDEGNDNNHDAHHVFGHMPNVH
jgi:hypothetical protein